MKNITALMLILFTTGVASTLVMGRNISQGDIHVAVNGSDIAGNGSSQNPFATIQKAVDAASNGEVILVQPGTYSGNGNRELDFKGKTLQLISKGGPDATLVDCGRKMIGTLANGEGPETLIKGFTFFNAYKNESRDWNSAILLKMKDTSPTIENCIFRNNAADGTFYTGTSGAYLMHSSGGRPVVRNCLIYGNRLKSGDNSTGSALFGGNYQLIDNCTVTDNTIDADMINWWYFIRKSLLGAFQTDDATVVSRCVVWNNSISVIGNRSERSPRKTPPKGPVIEHTLFAGGHAGTGNIDQDPKFKNPANNDYSLLPDSPAIAAEMGFRTDKSSDRDDPDSPHPNSPPKRLILLYTQEEVDELIAKAVADLFTEDDVKSRAAEAREEGRAAGIAMVKEDPASFGLMSMDAGTMSPPFVTGWCYVENLDWIYVSPEIFPCIFVENVDSWVYVQEELGELSYFVYDLEMWVTYEELLIL